MKKVVAVLTWPFRALRKLIARLLGGLGRLLKRLLRPLGKPFVKLAKLRGKARIAVLVVLGAALVFAILALKPKPNEEERVRAKLAQFADATRAKDYQRLCDDIYADDFVARISSVVPCEVALRVGLEERQNPRLEVLGVEVNGDQALARVRATAVGEPVATETIRLVRKDDKWFIASPLGSAAQGQIGP